MPGGGSVLNRLSARCRPLFVGQWRQYEKLDGVTHEHAAVEEAVEVGDTQLHPLEPEYTGGGTFERVFHGRGRPGGDGGRHIRFAT